MNGTGVLQLILLQVNMGSHNMTGFAKQTLYTQAIGQFHQRGAVSHEKKKKPTKLCYVTCLHIANKHIALSQQRTLHEDSSSGTRELRLPLTAEVNPRAQQRLFQAQRR